MLNMILLSCAIIVVLGIIITMIIILSVRYSVPKKSGSKDNCISLEPFENYQRIVMLINDKIRDFSYTISSELKSHDIEIKGDIYTDFRMRFAEFYLKGSSALVPKCLIEAKEKGYFDEHNIILIDGIKYSFGKLIKVSETEILVSLEFYSPKDFTNAFFISVSVPSKFTIYKDGMWAELIVVKPEEIQEDIED